MPLFLRLGNTFIFLTAPFFIEIYSGQSFYLILLKSCSFINIHNFFIFPPKYVSRFNFHVRARKAHNIQKAIKFIISFQLTVALVTRKSPSWPIAST